MAEQRYLADEEVLDEFFWDARTTGTSTGSLVLAAGVEYRVTIQGNWTERLVSSSSHGNQDEVMFGHGAGQNRANRDVDVRYASRSSGDYPHHFTGFTIDVGDGNGYQHIEPDGGPYDAPTLDHFYVYTIMGHGEPVSTFWNDDPYSDNGGGLWIVIYAALETIRPMRMIQRGDGAHWGDARVPIGAQAPSVQQSPTRVYTGGNTYV